LGDTQAPGNEPKGRRPADEALERALSDLRREIRARFPARPEPPRSRFDGFALFDEVRRRMSSVGMSERTGEQDAFGMDEMAVRRLRPLLDLLCRRWWRVEVSGLHAIPAEGPALFVANHAGLLPWDGLVVAHVLASHLPRAPRPRFLLADWLLTLPFAHATLARLGGVRACPENARRLLRAGCSVIAFPEGAKGATKPFRDRYRLKRFGRGGVVRLALEEGVPVVPVAVVGAEEVHPVLFKVESLVRGLGLPFLPVTPTFPWLGPFGAVPLPSKWSISFGPPLATEHLGPEAARDELLISRLTDELRRTIQAMVDAGVRARPGVFALGPRASEL
jgi:1-acyl-sn-glycerol-3-phosphate acyltransferase